METENEIFTAIINNNEELALKLIDENTNDITKLNIREENLLSTAVFYNMDKLVSKLLSLDSFKSVINKGINPFYTWNSRLENYFQDLSNSYEHSFLERKFDTEKSFKILELFTVRKFEFAFMITNYIMLKRNKKFRKRLLITIIISFLININNIGNVQQPSKLIDYALSKRPILSISSEFGETEQANFVQFLNHNYNNRTEVRNIEQFDIQNVCQNFIDLYNKCIMHE